NLPSSVMLDPDIAEQNLEISLDAIAPGESKTAEWQLVCVAVGTGEELSVTAIGSNGCEGETSATDSVLVDQMNPGDLEVVVSTDPPSPYYVGQEFTVSTTVSNVGQVPAANVTDVMACISLPVSVELNPDVADQSLDIGLDTIVPGESKTAEWQVVCVAVGTGEEISATAAGGNSCGGETSASGIVTVDQMNPGQLAVDVAIDPVSPFCIGQEFALTATVSNVGQTPAEDASDVMASMGLPSGVELNPNVVDQSLDISLDTIAPGESKIAEWQVVCVGVGTGDIEVTAIGKNGYEGETSASDTVTVEQRSPGAISIEIVTAPVSPFCVGQVFEITANLSNIGPAPAADISDISATLSLPDSVELDPNVPAQTVNVSLPSIAQGQSLDATWYVYCKQPGSGEQIMVEVLANDGCDSAQTTSSANINIDQIESRLVTTILSPADGTDFAVCDEFDVEVRVENTGNVGASNIVPVLSVAGEAIVEGGPNPASANIPMGESQIYMWKLRCNGLGNATITVDSVSGQDDCSGSDIPSDKIELPNSISVNQVYLIELWGPEWDPEINPEGWNQISLMVRPDNSAIDQVLGGVQEKVEEVWYYDASTEEWGGTWIGAHWDPDNGWSGELQTIEDGKGYWIKVKENCSISLSGAPVQPGLGDSVPPSYTVYKGWNLVGFSSLESMGLDEYFYTLYYNDIFKKAWWWGSGPWYEWSLDDDVVRVPVEEGWMGDPIMSGEMVIMPSTALMPSGVSLKPGQGYWIWVADDSEIVVPWGGGELTCK
ncbi:MAG: hypothetical protein SVY53_08165, partial [Chloroflexota bacterium]|nr:hypothetical protein [Chloroflexota bacterium]